MLLADLVACADEVAATSSRTAKIETLAELLGGADRDEAGVVAGLIAGDPRQGRIGVGWATVAALRTAPAVQPTLSVADLDGVLDAVAGASGEGSTQRRLALLSGFLARTTAAEADFVRRLLVGELRQGASEGVVVEAVARAARVPAASVRRALMLVGDLGETAAVALSRGRPGLEAVGFQTLRPIRPMLASTADDAASAVADMGRCSVEWKLDGVRIQAHRRGDEVRIWTRNLNEVTGRLGEVVEVVRALPVHTAALDGEVLGLAEDLSPAAFQDTMGRVGTRRTSEAAAAAAGPVRVRARVLRRLAPGRARPARRAPGGPAGMPGEGGRRSSRPRVVTEDPDEAERVFDAAVAAGHEGVMVKAAGAPYAAGRRGKAWRKVKPVRRLDLVVLAVEPGSGRRRGWLSNIHLGARDHDGGFVMVGKTFRA